MTFNNPHIFLILLLFIPSCFSSATAQESDLELFFLDETMVETSSKYPEPLMGVAENISIITSSQLMKMNAHTLYDALNRVVGININPYGGEVGGYAHLQIHSSSPNDTGRVLVLLDNIRLNDVANGTVVLNGIPLGIVERVEIIKGPASSTWGSSIGGVINIITKKPLTPVKMIDGTLSMSYGEANTRNLRGEFDVKLMDTTNYFFLGDQYSDGHLQNRLFDCDQFYAKSTFSPSEKSQVTLSGGYFFPKWKGLEAVNIDIISTYENPKTILSANLDYSLSKYSSFHIGASLLKSTFITNISAPATGPIGPPGANYSTETWDERKINLSTRLVYQRGAHNLVLGAEYEMESFDYSFIWGPASNPNIVNREDFRTDLTSNVNLGFFVHDTLVLGKLSITPGLRFDYIEKSDSVISPSLGLTYRLSEDTRLRATVSRGFSKIYLGPLVESSPSATPNPDLKPDKLWSFQAGLETKAFPYLYMKSNLFYHDIEQGWAYDFDLHVVANGEESKRYGYELEVETVPVNNFSVGAGFSYVHGEPEQDDSYSFSKLTGKLQYSGSRTHLELFGSYYDRPDEQMEYGVDEQFIWDFNMSRDLHIQGWEPTMFMTIHNLTNESQYWSWRFPNPGRWVEAGLRFSL